LGSFQVYDALNIVFKLEKPLVEQLEGFILVLREGDCKKNSKLLTENSSSRT
jgi:hypothetical protein